MGIYTLLTLQDTDTGELLGCAGGVDVAGRGERKRSGRVGQCVARARSFLDCSDLLKIGGSYARIYVRNRIEHSNADRIDDCSPSAGDGLSLGRYFGVNLSRS